MVTENEYFLKNMAPLVSIILPNYNHAQFLKERLSCIFNQTYQNFEVIILDDASTDDSLAILAHYRENLRVTHFITSQHNSGSPFIQWKKGLSLAKGDYIWIAESDDFCELNFLETQLKYLSESAISVAKTIVVGNGKRGNEIIHPIFRKNKIAVLDKEHILYCPILNVSAGLFHKIDEKELDEGNFANYRIIGDRVFYHEFFHNKRLSYNGNTQCYFRQEFGNLSNLDAKDLNYLIRYFKEHVKFINMVSKTNLDLKEMRKPYITRFYNRVRHRVTRKNKFSVEYLKLYIYYRFQLLI